MAQQIDEPMETKIIGDTDILISYRQRFREYDNLEDKLDLIYMIIEQNHLLLETELNDEKNKFELKLERLKYTNLTLINDLKKTGKIIDYETDLSRYNSLKEEIRTFFGKICSLFLKTMHERYKEDRAFQKYMAMYAEARNTPELTTQTWLTNALDDAYMLNAVEAGLIDKEQADEIREKAKRIQEMNEQKAKEFYDMTEKLKKAKAKGKGETKK